MGTIDVNGQPAEVSGEGAVVALPRVTLRMTARQLTKLHNVILGSFTPDDLAEVQAVAQAIEHLQKGPFNPECVYDISLAPEVARKY